MTLGERRWTHETEVFRCIIFICQISRNEINTKTDKYIFWWLKNVQCHWTARAESKHISAQLFLYLSDGWNARRTLSCLHVFPCKYSFVVVLCKSYYMWQWNGAANITKRRLEGELPADTHIQNAQTIPINEPCFFFRTTHFYFFKLTHNSSLIREHQSPPPSHFFPLPTHTPFFH